MSDQAKQALLTQYRARLAERAQTLRLQWANGAFSAVLDEVHKIAGSAGYYDLPELSQQARQTEGVLRQPQQSAQHRAIENLCNFMVQLAKTPNTVYTV